MPTGRESSAPVRPAADFLKMVELPRQIAEALGPAFAEADDFEDRIIGAADDYKLTAAPRPVRSAFRFGRPANKHHTD